MSKLHLPLLLGIFMATAVLVVGVRNLSMAIIKNDCLRRHHLRVWDIQRHDSNEVVCFHICTMALVWAEHGKSLGQRTLDYFRNERKIANCPDIRDMLA